MITELIAILTAGGTLAGGGLFLSRWVDDVSDQLKELKDGQQEIHDEQMRVRAELAIVKTRMPNGELKELVDEVRMLRDRLS